MTVRSKVQVCGLSIAGSVGSNLAEVMAVSLRGLVFVVQVAKSTTSWSLAQRSLNVCVCVCDLEASKLRRPGPELSWATKKKYITSNPISRFVLF